MFGKNKQVRVESLAAMSAELKQVKLAAEEFNQDLNDTMPEDIDFDNMDDVAGAEDKGKEDFEGEDKEKAETIKTPEDAKKALDEAKKDISNVIDNLDGLLGQAEEEEKVAAIKRASSEKYASDISKLATSSVKAIEDAKDAMNHWAYLTKLPKKPFKSDSKSQNVTANNLRESLNTIKEAKKVVTEVEKIFTKEATSVPPTGAKFTGDKWPENKDPKNVEENAWHKGAEKFKKDIKWEESRPNPATDERLTTVEYSRDDAPFVNATLKVVPGENKFATYWDIFDTKENKRMLVTFASLPDDIGTKDDSKLKLFSSKAYGDAIVSNIVGHGFDVVAEKLAGRIAKYDAPSLMKTAAESKSNVKKYYTDAYGDSGFAKAMTAGKDKSDMDVEYKPKDDKVKEYDEKTKDGTGKLSAQENLTLVTAKANQAVRLAVIASSKGVIGFNQKEIRAKAAEYMKLSDDAFKAVSATLNSLPTAVEAALKTSHIPDTEVGIVGNTAQGVTDPKASVDTEDIDSSVASDAKTASIVPQISADNSLQKKQMFQSRIVNNLQKKNALNNVRNASYKTS